MRKPAAVRRAEVLELAAQGCSPGAIATRLGLTDRQIRHYLHDPATTAELRRLQDDRLRALSRQALDAAASALGVLRGVAEDDRQPAPARVAGARAILDAALRLVESADLAERVTALEERLSDTKTTRKEGRPWAS